jgi:hypothetical protein
LKKYLLKLTLIVVCTISLLAAFVAPAIAAATTFENSTTVNGIDVFYGTYWRAQTFQPSQTHTITSVQLPLLNRGNTSGDVTVSIRATDANGAPAGPDLAAGSIQINTITTAWIPTAWYTFNLGSGCVVEQGKTYAIVWRAPSATTTMYYWMNMSGNYAKGQVMASTGGTSWSNLSTWDAGFRESGESGTQPPPATTTPTTTAPPPATTTTPPGTVALYENNASTLNGIWDFSGAVWRGQTFTPSVSHTITKIDIPLLKRGTASGNVIVSVKATDTNGYPVGSDLATGELATSAITSAWTPAVWYSFNLGAGCAVEAGKTYAIVLRAPSAVSETGLYYWLNLNGGYNSGKAVTGTSGASWSTLNTWDSIFREYGVSGTQPPPATTTTTPPPTTTTTTPPPTTTTTTTVPGGLRHTGWISIYFADNTNIIPWDQLSSLVYQNVYCASSSNPTLLLQGGYSWSQMTNLSNQANAHGVPMLACLWGGGDPAQNDHSPVLLNIISNATLKQQLFNNLNALCSQYNLAGIAIDWEGSEPDAATYAQFLKDMRAALGTKLITPIGNWTSVDIASTAAPYVSWLSLMSYDYWTTPYYGTLANVQNTVNTWINAGWPKNKIDIGIEFKDMTGVWSPVDVITAKAAWAKSFGLGGAWGYEIGYQQQNNLGQLQAIYNGLGATISR